MRYFRNKVGWLKLRFRKKFWLFGDKLFFITGTMLGKKTYVCYRSITEAYKVYDIIKSAMINEENRRTNEGFNRK